ncbi:hypothetical protein [Sulfitobacter sp.]|uniref:hypothetical protein n=1 Tax=Sulfitobacter sp. TaxID=1903071 RepID=UPI00356AAFAF
MNSRSPPGLRILIGAGSFADAAAGFGIIKQLPIGFCAGLGGILVEELDLLATTGIPDRRVILSSGKATTAPTQSQLRMLWKADARAFRELLAHVSGPYGTQSVFMQDKGDLVRTALRAAVGWDVLVLGYRQIHRIPGKVIHLKMSGTVGDQQGASDRFSHLLSPEPVVFSINESPDEPLGADPSTPFKFRSLDDALAALARMNAKAVLVDFGRGPIRGQDDLLRLLEAARCPVIVFDASRPPALLEHSTQFPPAPANGGPQNAG